MDSSSLLFGTDPLECVVAVEVLGAEAVLYRRQGDAVTRESAPFRPWVYAREPFPLDGVTWTKTCDPAEGLLFMVGRFEDWPAFLRGRRELRDAGAEFLAPASPQRQFLTASGITLFKGMNFGELHCLQLDLETTGLSPFISDARILMVAICDNRGFEETVVGAEPDILRRVGEIIRERDPDVIEGHNIVDFDLAYLFFRAEAHGQKLEWGRDGSEIVRLQRQSQNPGGLGRGKAVYYVHGRHIVDTMNAVKRFDATRMEMSSYGLKAAAEFLGIAEPDRIILDGSRMAELFAADPNTVSEYAMQDVRETRALAELLCATEFYQTQMVPEAYQNIQVMGMGDKINALMQRAYLAAAQPIPLPRPTEMVPGGYTDVRRTGVLRPVVKADAQSLYPSIMLRFHIAPKTDRLGVFLPMLEELTSRRIEAKGKMANATGMERTYWDGLQGSFKILINSFYGYLGAVLHFNDPDAAGQVTLKGQEIVKTAADEIERCGGQVIEVDTDGIYFVPPEGIQDDTAFVEEIGKAVPEGIHLVHDGSYAAMLSLKVKNYVLQRRDGSLIFHGASMRSRADERFGREFLEQCVRLMFEGHWDGLTDLYIAQARAIHEGRVPIGKLARRERVTEKTFRSNAKKRARAAVEQAGASVGDYVQVYQCRGGALKPLDAFEDDEDRDYYIDKLYKFAGRLEPALEDRFNAIFPRPDSPRMGIGPQQSLFDDF